MLGTCSPLSLQSGWQKAAIRSLNTTPQNSYKITPSYEIPTCQQVHIGYCFTFCSSWHQLLLVREFQITRYGLYSQSSYYKMDLKPCNLENAIFAGTKPREEIWEMFNVFHQTLSEAITFLLPSCQCYQYSLLHNPFTRGNNHHINSSARFKVPSHQIHEAGWAEKRAHKL